MSGHARPWDLKARQRNLTPVLRRPVELAPESGQLADGLGMSAWCQSRLGGKNDRTSHFHQGSLDGGNHGNDLGNPRWARSRPASAEFGRNRAAQAGVSVVPPTNIRAGRELEGGALGRDWQIVWWRRRKKIAELPAQRSRFMGTGPNSVVVFSRLGGGCGGSGRLCDLRLASRSAPCLIYALG
jgi:hypothetical protein